MTVPRPYFAGDPADLIDPAPNLAGHLARLRPDWHGGAACRGKGTRMFYENAIAARLICDGCPVIDQCRDHAVEHHELGVWGATSERQRVVIRRERKAR